LGCDATFRDAPTMSRIIDAMERQDLLERRPHPTDGRSRTVHLTRHGRALEKKLVPLVGELVAGMVKGVDDRALATTRNTLKKMFANLEG